MKTVAILLVAAAAQLPAAEDPREIMRRGIEAFWKNQEVERNYTYVRRNVTRTLLGDGSVKRTEIRTYDVTLSEGTPYDRLIQIDDKPLPPDQERREQEKLRQSIEARQKETPQQRAQRIADWESRRKKNRAFVNEILEAMDFRLAGEDRISDRKTWIVEATPHPGYRPRSTAAKFLAKMRGRMWIDQQDYTPARIEAEAIGDVSFGAFLAKVRKGTRFSLEDVRVNGEVWLPKRVEAKISARVLAFPVAQEAELTFRDYRKFHTESRILSTDADEKR